MATTNILGLFTSPEDYQAQQAANDQQRAVAFSSMDPRQLANYSLFMGGQQLGRGLAGVLGVQDPQLQRIRQRQEIMQTINPADPDSLMAGIQRASQAGDQELALTLADYTRKARGDLALAQQREREKVPEAIQISEEIRKLTVQRDALPEGAERNAIDAQIKRLEIAKKSAGSTETPEYKNAFQLTVAENPTLDTESADFKQKLSSNYNKLLFKDKADKTTELKDLLERRDVAVSEFGLDSYAVQSLDRLINSIAPLKGTAETKPEAVRTAEAYADVINSDRNSTEWKEAFTSQLNKRDKANLTVVGEVRSGPDKGKTVYVDENKDQQFIYSADSTGKQVRKLISDADVSRLTSQVSATATSTARLPAGEDEVVRGLGKLDVAELETVRGNKRAAIAANASLKKLSELNDAGLIGGAFASGRVGVSNFLNTIGLLSSADKNRLVSSEQYSKVGSDLVFQSLQGKLGTGVSNADRDFIEKIFPRLENSAAARRELINYLADKNNALINEGNRAEKYLREKKSFKDYTPLVDGIFNAPSGGTARTMTDAELDAAIAKKRKEGK